MSHGSPQARRLDAPTADPTNDRRLEAIDQLGLELAAAGEATGSGQVPIAARADYLRAEAAHQRALTAWTAAGGPQQLAVVDEALEEGRTALASTRAGLRR